MKIITLTLNPAFDIHCHAPHFEAYCENFVEITGRDAGGKGINISRALCSVGVPNTALVILGEENQADFTTGLARDGLSILPISVPGRIRENITIHTDDSAETRISFCGFSAPNDLLDRIYGILEREFEEGEIVTLTGSLPNGMAMLSVKKFLKKLLIHGVRVVIDSRSFTLDDLIEIKPWLIKPNEEELVRYFGCEMTEQGEMVREAQRLVQKGIANVMISLGDKGALVASNVGTYVARPPKIEALSTIGAGDSSIAGFLVAVRKGLCSADCLCHAVSFGTASCLTEGTQPPKAEDIDRLRGKIDIQKI